ncbi:hypothetical protein [Leptothoe spongobia]|uniref:Tail sheath protein subtilisin-like domain-containing protein n=1 Tax=Leptothoe spongobia TAU-MAC 1115 TaxID=1967444 RepID=A0A947DGL8_9CYAN|nr:hypothetical protein [Leptothoe spongobia]MBT9316294.1 hypothetical protein [Leptothoe spongobia TAU-MAC 1115]
MSGVLFGQPSSLIRQPGAYTRVDASGLVLNQAFASNIVCIVGQALGGDPLQIYKFNDASQSDAVFGPKSPLAQAIKLAFRGGVNGGAPLVYGVRADNSAQASGVLTAVNGTQIQGTMKDFGGYGNTFSINFEDGSVQGTKATVLGTNVQGKPYRQVIDNETSFSRLIQRLSDESPMELSVLTGGQKASQTLTIATSTDDGKATITDQGNTTVSTEGYFYQYPQSLGIVDSQKSLLFAFNATISWNISALATSTFTAPGHSLTDGTPIKFSGTTLPPEVSTDTIYYVRDTSGDNFAIAATSGGAALTLTGTVDSATVIRAFGTTLIASALPAVVEGSYAAAADAVTDAYSQTPTNNISVTDTAYGSNIYRMRMSGVDRWGHNAGQGLIGSIFAVTGGDYAGTYQIMHQEWDGLSTDQTRVVQKLTTGDLTPGTFAGTLDFWPSLRLPKTQPATEAIETQLPANGNIYRGGQFLTISLDVPDEDTIAVFYSTEPGDTIESIGEKIVGLINEDAAWDDVAISAATYNGGTFTSTITITAVDPGIVGNSYKPNILVNTQTTVLVATGGLTLEDGVDPEPPRDALGNTTGALIMASGFDSVPNYQRHLEALEAIKFEPLRWIVCLSDDAAVQAAYSDHVTQMSSTPQRRERMVIMGHGLGWTDAEIRARAETFNNERVVFVSPGLRMADLATGAGARTYSSAQATTAVIAGMLAAEGNGISDPITHTFLTNVLAAEKEYVSGSIALDEMLTSGVLTIEKDPTLVRESRGYRVTRGLTTWRIDNSLESITVVNQSDFIAQVIRDLEETLFVGKALVPTTLPVIVESVNLELQRRSEEQIIYGFEAGATTATINPDNQGAVDVAYTIYPAPALEFVLNTQILLPIPSDSSN